MLKERREKNILSESRDKFLEIIRKNKLDDVGMSVLVKTLTPFEAIGEPGRRDFPIIIGKERVIEAEFLGARAQAFTDSPKEFIGKLKEILNFPLTSNGERAIYIAALNAVLKFLHLVEGTLHCKDDEPEKCASEISSYILKKWGKIKVGLIGLNPALAEMLVSTFGSKDIKITDLNQENINSLKYGVEIWDGNEMTNVLISSSDVILITGTTFVNGTSDSIIDYIKDCGKDYLIYGATGVGVCKLIYLNRICPFGK
jgi:uncharacterized protein (DUF4213/DUF364 family)